MRHAHATHTTHTHGEQGGCVAWGGSFR
jgi:hypothetical protein